jgi:hypothetical protein
MQPDLNQLLLNDPYRCLSDTNCCVKGYSLGEKALPVTINICKYSAKNKSLILSGVVSLSNEMNKINVSANVGELIGNEFCHRIRLGIVDVSTGEFQFVIPVSNRTDVFYLKAVGFKPYLLRTGLLIEK